MINQKPVLIILTLTVLLSGCTTIIQQTRIPTSLNSMEYNSVASNYMERPTFVRIEDMSDGASVLAVEMEQYSYGIGGYENSNRWSIRFKKDFVSDYIVLINKYFDWEQTATSRKDAFTKEIGRVQAWSNGPSGKLKFVFHSGNEKTHYMAVSFCSVGTCLDNEALYFSKNDVSELKNLLSKFESGVFKQTDINRVYN